MSRLGIALMLTQDFPAVHLVAHRGQAVDHPENSLSALLASIAAGARIVEFDIQLAADAVAVVMHDEQLLRTTGCPGRVGDFTSMELARWHCGYSTRFGDRFATEPIPTLTEMVAALGAGARVQVLAELKDESIARFGLGTCMQAVLTDLEPIRDQTVFISFSAAAVRAAAAAGWPTGWCLETHDAAALQTARALAPDMLLTDERAIASAADVWDGPWRWAAWEVVDPVRAIALMQLGVHYVESMDVRGLLANPEVREALSK
ncbi:MAG: glycerophosphodiester phosphodiesterase family protein [Pseudomonadota bacterium]